jgi:hypothetical protein
VRDKVALCAQMAAIMVVYVVLMRRCVKAGYAREVATSIAVGVPLAAAIAIISVVLVRALP